MTARNSVIIKGLSNVTFRHNSDRTHTEIDRLRTMRSDRRRFSHCLHCCLAMRHTLLQGGALCERRRCDTRSSVGSFPLRQSAMSWLCSFWKGGRAWGNGFSFSTQATSRYSSFLFVARSFSCCRIKRSWSKLPSSVFARAASPSKFRWLSGWCDISASLVACVSPVHGAVSCCATGRRVSTAVRSLVALT